MRLKLREAKNQNQNEWLRGSKVSESSSKSESNASYEGGFDASTAVVKNFWQWIKNADASTQDKLLKFATGSPKAPIGGLGKMPFKIQRAGPDSMQLPTAHTCFNTLILRTYYL